MSPRKKNTAFTSIRIIGQKAQRMISKAKTSLATEEEQVVKTLPKKKPQQEMVMHLSIQSVVRATFAILAIGLLALLVYHLRQKILLLLLAGFVATLIDPGVTKMEQWGIPRAIAILIQYLFALALLIYAAISLVPVIAEQVRLISSSISVQLDAFMKDPFIDIPILSDTYDKQISRMLQITLQNISIDQFTTTLEQTGQNWSDVAGESIRFIIKVAGSVLNFIVSLVVVLVLSFFMQMEKERIGKWFRSFLPQKYRAYADVKTEAIHTKIGQWMRGEMLLMFSIFLLTFIALFVLGLGDFALTLAVFAGFCELIPAIGPFFAAIPALLIAGTQKGLIWIPILAFVYYMIQWCENNLLVPLIMKRAVGLSPIAILFAMLVGISFANTLHPILGVMLAVPTTTIIALFLEDWRKQNRD